MNDEQMKRVAEIERRANKATCGPWSYSGLLDEDQNKCLGNGQCSADELCADKSMPGIGCHDIPVFDTYPVILPMVTGDLDEERCDLTGLYEDFAFIAHSREDIPFLLELVKELQAKIDAKAE